MDPRRGMRTQKRLESFQTKTLRDSSCTVGNPRSPICHGEVTMTTFVVGVEVEYQSQSGGQVEESNKSNILL